MMLQILFHIFYLFYLRFAEEKCEKVSIQFKTKIYLCFRDYRKLELQRVGAFFDSEVAFHEAKISVRGCVRNN